MEWNSSSNYITKFSGREREREEDGLRGEEREKRHGAVRLLATLRYNPADKFVPSFNFSSSSSDFQHS